MNSRPMLITVIRSWLAVLVLLTSPMRTFATCKESRCAVEQVRDISLVGCGMNGFCYQGSSRFQLRTRENKFSSLAPSGRIPCIMEMMGSTEDGVVSFAETTCTLEATGASTQCDSGICYYEGFVTFRLQGSGNEFSGLAETGCIPCTLKMVSALSGDEIINHKDRRKLGTSVRLLPPESRTAEENSFPLGWVLATTCIIAVIFFTGVMLVIFRNQLIRICPRFVLTAWMNIRRVDRRTSSRVSNPLSQRPEDFVSTPPPIESRRRISKLIEFSKVPAGEAKALREGGWSCCICLEDETEQLRSVARLKCNHATHSDCLRLWLETGRAACCLCNADVFSDGTKEPSFSSRASSVSDGDAGFIGSLVVERTDRTPSSPGTSVFIDASQPYSDTAPSNDEHDTDIERGLRIG